MSLKKTPRLGVATTHLFLVSAGYAVVLEIEVINSYSNLARIEICFILPPSHVT